MERAEIEALVKGFIAKQGGDADRAAGVLYDENHSLREKNRKLESDLAAALAKVPAEGTLVLTADQVKSWLAYLELGEPKDIKKMVDEFPKLQDELTGLRKADVLGQAADLHGFKKSVLEKLGKDLELEIGEVTVDKDGKSEVVKVAYVKDASGNKTKLDDYAKTQWSEFMPSLEKPKEDNSGGNGSNGKQYLDQGSGGSGNGGSLVDQWIQNQGKQASSVGNPLAPAKSA